MYQIVWLEYFFSFVGDIDTLPTDSSSVGAGSFSEKKSVSYFLHALSQRSGRLSLTLSRGTLAFERLIPIEAADQALDCCRFVWSLVLTAQWWRCVNPKPDARCFCHMCLLTQPDYSPHQDANIV